MFGLGHYRYTVTCLPEDAKGKVWGRSHYNHSEEFFDIQVVPDGVLPEVEQRHLILHELAHGILQFAYESSAGCETACNRIAKMVLGGEATGPNYSTCGGPNGDWPSFDEGETNNARRTRSNPRKNWDEDKERKIVKMLDSVPDLTDRQRYVLGAIYVQGHSFREVARALGVSPRTVTRVRDQLVKRLAEKA